MGGQTMIAVLATVAASLAPATARADVLVSRPSPSIRCGAQITTGVWYRDFPTRGSRQATITVLSAGHTPPEAEGRGAVLWRKQVVASDRWRYFHYRPHC